MGGLLINRGKKGLAGGAGVHRSSRERDQRETTKTEGEKRGERRGR